METELKLLLMRMYHKIVRLANYAAKEWDMQWTLTAVAVLAVVIFILREKPVTNLVIWLKNKLVRLFKWLWKQFKKLLVHLHINNLSPKLNRFTEEVDGLSALKFGRYNRPHYLTLSWNSDLSAILQNIYGHDTDTVKLEEARINQESNNHWHIFDKGCVFDFAEPLSIIDELQGIRPERPLDGIIVCISSEELLNNDFRTIQARAEQFHKQLWQIQIKQHFVLPVYILVTDCDELTGFDTFWQNSIVKPHHDELLGWSNPHEKCRDFERQWIVDGMQTLCHNLRILQRKLLFNVPSKLATLLFPQQLERLQKPLANFCESLFHQSSFHHSFMLRGFYFTGSLSNTDAEEDLNQNSEINTQPLFIKDLFAKKIFAEANIAFAPSQKLFSSNRKLKTFQYLAFSAFLLMSSWLSYELVLFDRQVANLTSAIYTQESTEYDLTHQQDSVNLTLDNMTKMKASNLFYWSIPATWYGYYDQKLMNYFAENIFGDRIFPVMECQISSQIATSLEQFPDSDKFTQWLDGLVHSYQQRNNLSELMHRTDLTQQEVKTLFNLLVAEILGNTLPTSFNKRSDIYFDAIRKKSYASAINECPFGEIEDEQAWSFIAIQLQRFEQTIKHQVAAPSAFFAQLQKLESLPINKSDPNDFFRHLELYLNWSANMSSHWLNHEGYGVCQNVASSIQTLTHKINDLDKAPEWISKELIGKFEQTCTQLADAQLEIDQPLVQPSLYTESHHNRIMFSVEANKLQMAMQSLANLSFINAKPDADLAKYAEEFFWSVEHLNQALAYYQEYKLFAETNYSSITLVPSVDGDRQAQLGQAVALKQLEQAMLNSISRARIKAQLGQLYRPVNRQEAEVAAYLGNFSEVKGLLLQLHQVFIELNFAQSNQQFLSLAHNHAYYLLQKVDKLYKNSHVYQPLTEPFWGAHQYIKAMFGIASEGQLSDYLASQSDRMSYIALNYVEPLLFFLSATQARATNYQLYSLWQNTLVELDKQTQHKDAQNSQQGLIDFMNNQLLLTDQSNCFKQGKEFISPQSNNQFAIAQRHIVKKAKNLCQSYTADQILKEYKNLFRAFTDRLANKYPFTRAHQTRAISPREIKDFLEIYPGKSTGLAKRMEILQWSKRDSAHKALYQDATQFVVQLDRALDFFSSAIASLEAGSKAGLELNIEFDVLPEQAQQVNHITQWTLSVGSQLSGFPNDEDTNQKTAIWRPNNSISMELDWAKNSPYQATPVLGKKQQEQLIYESSGMWSLLDFITKYRSDIHDEHALSDASILLNFNAELLGDNGAKIHPNAIALARVTLLGPDATTKELKAILLPDAFPSYAPDIDPSTQGATP